ncbi:MAG: addiction module toxin RelE [Muribaculaceae bacterium]|nr:addiction module toxin RelE [Muribaculaceae bacterium]
MSFEISTTAEFEKQAKALYKRHRSFKNDLLEFVKSLRENPFQGVELSPGIRKIRMTITSKGRGKSAGARVITYTIVSAAAEGRVYLMNIYDKADFSRVLQNSILVERVLQNSEKCLQNVGTHGSCVR